MVCLKNHKGYLQCMKAFNRINAPFNLFDRNATLGRAREAQTPTMPAGCSAVEWREARL
jgi:hypothetical protein